MITNNKQCSFQQLQHALQFLSLDGTGSERLELGCAAELQTGSRCDVPHLISYMVDVSDLSKATVLHMIKMPTISNFNGTISWRNRISEIFVFK